MSSLTSRSLAAFSFIACCFAAALRAAAAFLVLLEEVVFFCLLPEEADFLLPAAAFPLPEFAPAVPVLPEALLPVFFVLFFVLCAMNLPVRYS